ncbi:MAG: lipopolysaccharide assembly protein LapA domain-containing protein [Alphaproteobacteria bacterium]
MRLIIGIVVFIPCAVLLTVFAVENRQAVALEFWPLAGKIETSASVWLLLFLAAGILAGLCIGLLSTLAWRRRAYRAERRNRTLERKLDERIDPPMPAPEPVSGGALPATVSPPSRSARAALIDD